MLGDVRSQATVVQAKVAVDGGGRTWNHWDRVSAADSIAGSLAAAL